MNNPFKFLSESAPKRGDGGRGGENICTCVLRLSKSGVIVPQQKRYTLIFCAGGNIHTPLNSFQAANQMDNTFCWEGKGVLHFLTQRGEGV